MIKTKNYNHFLLEVLLKLAIFSAAACLHASSVTASDLLAQSSVPFIEFRSELPSATNDTSLKMRAAQLLRFLSRDAYSKLPVEVQERLSNRKFIVTVVKSNTADGLFVDTSHTGSSDLHIEMNYSRLLNENAFQILAHEFFHAVHHVINPGQKAWIREGLAQLFEFRTLRYFNGVNVEAALKDLSIPLEAEYSIDKIIPAQYGHNLLYFYYLWKNCGGDNLLWQIASNGLESAFSQGAKEQCASFESSVVHFEIARAHNRRRFDVKDNSMIHYLLSTTAKPVSEISALTEEEIKAMPRYSAVVLAPGAEVTSSPDRKLFWLQKDFPYAVSEKMPENSGKSWRVLLIKI